MHLDFVMQREPALRQGAHGGFGRRGRRCERTWPERGNMADQRDLAADLIEGVAQRGGRVDDQGFQRHHGLRPAFDRRVAGDLEMPDHLDRPGLRFGFGDRLSGEH